MSKRNSDLLEPHKEEICPTSYFVLGIEIYETDKNQKKAKPGDTYPVHSSFSGKTSAIPLPKNLLGQGTLT
jgi:hypothetical protein